MEGFSSPGDRQKLVKLKGHLKNIHNRKSKQKIMNDSSIPLIIRFTTWLRDNPYGMPSCLPNIMIRLDDESEHPCRRNILAAHSNYFKMLFSLNPEKNNFLVPNVSKEVFEIFLDFCYKRTIYNVTRKKFLYLYDFADFVQCQMLINLLDKECGSLLYFDFE